MKIKTFTFLLLISFIVIYNITYYESVNTIEIKVNDKERITNGSGESISSKYIIYTNKGVFQNTDELIFGKFNSSDLQNHLRIDSVYNVKVVGWRIPFFSMYKNIIEIK